MAVAYTLTLIDQRFHRLQQGVLTQCMHPLQLIRKTLLQYLAGAHGG